MVALKAFNKAIHMSWHRFLLADPCWHKTNSQILSRNLVSSNLFFISYLFSCLFSSVHAMAGRLMSRHWNFKPTCLPSTGAYRNTSEGGSWICGVCSHLLDENLAFISLDDQGDYNHYQGDYDDCPNRKSWTKPYNFRPSVERGCRMCARRERSIYTREQTSRRS